MTDPVPGLIGDISEPMPDDGHEAIRAAVVNAIEQVAALHQSLVDQLAQTQVDLTQTQADLTQTRTDLAALTDRVTALEPAPAPPPSPVVEV